MPARRPAPSRASKPHTAGNPNSPERGSPAPREDLVERRKAQILAHAIRHFAREGFASANLDQVIADIGCGKGTIYRYFKGKDELFRAAVDEVMRGLLEATAPSPGTGPSTGPDPLEELRRAVIGYLRYFAEHPEYVELLMLERAEFRSREEPTYFAYRRTHSRRWDAPFTRLMREGRMRRMPVRRVVDAVGNMLYGVLFTNHFSRTRPDPVRQADEVLDVLFHGLLTPGGRDARPGGGEARPGAGSARPKARRRRGT
ncbi:MAG: TetR/AcrR family transcriptional regulator [Phycisphaeraceae bacterium]|nr:TetR/AcrR family transcriptional regulator [Phycisphaeraceae bacterium]